MHIVLAILGTIAFALLVYSHLIEPRWIKRERLFIPVSNPLPPNGVSILHLSDIHFKKWNPRTVRMMKTLGKTEYDLVLLTGDMIDDETGIDTALAALRHLRARYGVYCVFGNHEYLRYQVYHWIEILTGKKFWVKKNPELKRFRDGLRQVPIYHMCNRSERLESLGITLAGVDDFTAGMTHMEKATRGMKKDTFNILMAHHPDSLLAVRDQPIDLALCGHTHGGQVRLPFIGAVFTDSKVPRHLTMGRVRIRGVDTYVSRGLSTSRYMIPRFLCRPEITEIHLMPKARSTSASKRRFAKLSSRRRPRPGQPSQPS